MKYSSFFRKASQLVLLRIEERNVRCLRCLFTASSQPRFISNFFSICFKLQTNKTSSVEKKFTKKIFNSDETKENSEKIFTEKRKRVTYWFYFTPSKRLTSNTTHKMEYITIQQHSALEAKPSRQRREMLCWHVTWCS